MFEKFRKFMRSSNNPFRLSDTGFFPGNSKIWEIPWPSFPFLKLPAGSGITTRMFGYIYTIISLEYALKTGNTAYYFHPYEINSPPKLSSYGSYFENFKMRNIGNDFLKLIEKFLERYNGYFTTGKNIIKIEKSIK